MPQLVLWSKERKEVVCRYPLEKSVTLIGRGPQNDLMIDDLTVSARHARIVRHGTDYVIEDLGSTNGTLVNGRRIQRKRLDHMDRVTMGRHMLLFLKTRGRTGPQAACP